MSRNSTPFRHAGLELQPTASPERRTVNVPRYTLDLPGRFMRTDKLDYPCRLKDISVEDAALLSPAVLSIGEHLIVYLLHLGGLEGDVVRRFPGGFAMAITATQRKRDKLANQIRRLSAQPDISQHEERVYPRHRVEGVATMRLFDGTTLDCPMLDVSRSGASIVVPIRPPLGTEVILANQRAVVVRHHDEGIAVEFVKNEPDEEALLDRFGGREATQR